MLFADARPCRSSRSTTSSSSTTAGGGCGAARFRAHRRRRASSGRTRSPHLGWVYCQGGGYFGGFDDHLGQGVYRGDHHVEGEVWDVSHPTTIVDEGGEAFEFDHDWAESFVAPRGATTSRGRRPLRVRRHRRGLTRAEHVTPAWTLTHSTLDLLELVSRIRFAPKGAVVDGAGGEGRGRHRRHEGIGRAIAEAFVREGAKVVINGRNEEKGPQALDEMDAGDAAMFVAGDAKVREDCERVVDTAVEQFGRIDIMVNNAGGASNHAPVADLTDEALRRRAAVEPVVDVLVHAPVAAAHDPAAVGPDHQHQLARGQVRQAGRVDLRHRQARHQRADQVVRPRGRHARDHRQRAVPRRHRDRHHGRGGRARPPSRWA